MNQPELPAPAGETSTATPDTTAVPSTTPSPASPSSQETRLSHKLELGSPISPTVRRLHKNPIAKWAAGGLGLVLAGTIGVALFSQLSGPDDVVEGYLTAIQQRDIDKAFDIAGVARPGAEQAAFLTPDALLDDWSIHSVRSTVETKSTAKVTTVLTRSGEENATGEFILSRENGNWRIDNPLVHVQLVAKPLSYFEANGIIIPLNRTTNSTYLMMPGLYRFYQTPSKVAEVHPTSMLLLPQGQRREPLTVPHQVTVALTRAGLDIVNQKLQANIDECVRQADPRPTGCPFGTYQSHRLHSEEKGHLRVVSGDWKLVRYPHATWSELQGGRLRIDDGIVQLRGSAQAWELPGRPLVSFKAECAVAGSYQIAVTSPETLHVGRFHGTSETCG